MERRIDLEGCNNFRDLGGYTTRSGRRVRWRTLFRSDALHLLSPSGVRRFVDELRISDVVDLRSTGELHSDGPGLLGEEEVSLWHLPLFDGGLAAAQDPAEMKRFTLADRYYLMAEAAQEPIARVVTALARAAGPAVYHCAAGKDRTGVISAILLGLLDVPDEVIVADYAATQENLDAIVDRLMNSEGYREVLETLPPDTMHAEPETMISLLDKLSDRYDGPVGYARHIGVGKDTLDRLRDRLLE